MFQVNLSEMRKIIISQFLIGWKLIESKTNIFSKHPPRPYIPLFVVGHSEEVLHADAGAGAGVEHVDGAGFDGHHNSDVADAPAPAAAEKDKVAHFPLSVGDGGTAVGVVAAAGRHQDAVLAKNVVHQAGTVESRRALAAGAVGTPNQRFAKGDDLVQVHVLRHLHQERRRVRRSDDGVQGGAKQGAQGGGVGKSGGGWKGNRVAHGQGI